ncbi:MAG: uracil-DNA glycosylase [Eubacteriales bacterium]
MIETIYQKIREAFPGRELVPGEGNPNAHIMLIGEAPGRTEVEQMRPFVGTAGKNLDRFLENIAFKRKDIYITNAVKFRPTRISEKGTASNRPPTTDEILAQRELLMEEVEAVGPKVIVTLGNVPLKSVLNDMRAAIGAHHGRAEQLADSGRYLFPLYHPASIIYRKELETVYEQDLLKLAEFIETLKF